MSSTPSTSSSEEREWQPDYEQETPPIIYENHSLTYASQKVDHIPRGLWAMYPRTKRLDLSFNRINTLMFLENFERLTELILDNNCITERITFPVLESLKLLSINNNRINVLSDFVFKVRDCFPNLIFLSLLRNKACPNMMFVPEHDEADYKRYRLYVLHYLPRLKFLDSTPVLPVEKAAARQRGHLGYVRTPRDLNDEELAATMPPRRRDAFRNISVSVLTAPRHRGEYMRTELSFANRESEGNRFITNHDL